MSPEMWSDIEGMTREWARRLETDLRSYLGSEAGLDDVLYGFLELMRGGRGNTASSGARQPTTDPYRILGLSQSATDEEIKKRYRELVRYLHPDTSKTAGTTWLFQVVVAAYEAIRRRRGWN